MMLAAVIAALACTGLSASITASTLPLPVAANAATAQPMATSASKVLRNNTASKFNLVSLAYSGKASLIASLKLILILLVRYKMGNAIS
jgi:hypothetical protein